MYGGKTTAGAPVSRRTTAVVGVLALIAAFVSADVASASHAGPGTTVGGFEIDGDFAFPTQGVNGVRDWATTAKVVMAPDEYDGDGNATPDDSFSDGSHENDPAGWGYGTGSVPGKGDLTRVYFANVVNPGDADLYLAFERLAVEGNGSAHANFELNQSTDRIVNAKGASIPKRTAGDLLVVYDFAGGGNASAVAVEVRRWSGTALNGSWNLATVPAGSVAADINNGQIARPEAAPFGGGNVGALRFGEVALNLDAIFGSTFLSCPGFAQFSVKTRASGSSFNSVLKDVAGPFKADLSTCGTVKLTKTDDSGQPLAGATFELIKDNGDSELTGADTAVGTCTSQNDGSCLFENVDIGSYFVREVSAPYGYGVDPTVVGPFSVAFRQDVVLGTAFVNPKLYPASSLTKAARRSPTDEFASSVSAQPGDTIEYRLRYANTGDIEATDVTVYDELPAHSTFDGCVGPLGAGDCTFDGTTITFDLGQVEEGDTVDVFFSTTLAATYSQNSTQITNVATASTNEEAEDASSNTVTVNVTANAAFTVEKSVDDPTPIAGDTVTYSILVTNVGAGPGSTSVTDDYDESKVSVSNISHSGSAAGGEISWTTGTLAPNESVTLTYDATLDTPFNQSDEQCDGGGFLVHNSVTVNGGSDSEDICVGTAPAFSVDKTVDDATPSFGDTITYSITVTNDGTGPGSTSVTDDYDESKVSVSNISHSGVAALGEITWTTDILDPNESVTFTYDATLGTTFNQSDDTCEAGGFLVHNAVVVDGGSDSQDICVATAPAFTVDKTVDDASPSFGDTITYSITVTNTGSGPGGTSVTDDYDESKLSVGNISHGGSFTEPGVIGWNTGTLDPNESVTFTYDAVLDTEFTDADERCEAGGFLVANAVSAGEADDTQDICVDAPGDPDVAKSASVTTAVEGESVTYTVTITNVGSGPLAAGVEAVDDYDQAHLSITDAGGGSDDDDTITFTTSSVLDPGQSESFTYTGTLIGTFNDGQESQACDGGAPFAILNSVLVSGDGSFDDELVCANYPGDPDVAKVADTTSASFGDSVTYTVTITNVGSGPLAAGVEAVDDYDQAHLSITDAGGGSDDDDTITFTTGSVLDPGQSESFTYTGTLIGTFNDGEQAQECQAGEFAVLNSVSVTDDASTGDETICVIYPGDASPEKQADVSTASVGGTVTYTVRVRNVGTGPLAAGAVAVDDYDQDHLSISNPGSGSDDGDTITFTTTGVLNPGAAETFTYAGTIIAPFTDDERDPAMCDDGIHEFPVLNSVSIEGDDSDPATTTVCVAAVPGLSISKAVRNVTDDSAMAGSAQADPGEELEFKITVSNGGDAEATDVTVTDTLAANLTFVSCEPVIICSEDAGTITWNIGSMPVGDQQQLFVRATTAEAFPVGITAIGNTATLDANEIDPTDSNEVLVFVTIFSKASCPTDLVVTGGTITYSLPWGVHGRALDGVTIVDRLPDEVTFVSADPAPSDITGNVVTWELGSVADGTQGEVTVVATAPATIPADPVLVNEADLFSDLAPVFTATDEVTVGLGESAHSERAYGVKVFAAGLQLIDPTPDTGEAVPTADPTDATDQVLAVPVEGVLDVDVLNVHIDGLTDEASSVSNASSTANDVGVLNQDGSWLVTATHLRSIVNSTATGSSATSSSEGSLLQDVVVDGQHLGTITEPQTITLTDPVLGTTTTVALLEHIPTGGPTPDGSYFTNGLTVNAIHVTVTDATGTLLAEVVVGHASSFARYLSGLPCTEDEQTPAAERDIAPALPAVGDVAPKVARVRPEQPAASRADAGPAVVERGPAPAAEPAREPDVVGSITGGLR